MLMQSALSFIAIVLKYYVTTISITSVSSFREENDTDSFLKAGIRMDACFFALNPLLEYSFCRIGSEMLQ